MAWITFNITHINTDILAEVISSSNNLFLLSLVLHTINKFNKLLLVWPMLGANPRNRIRGVFLCVKQVLQTYHQSMVSITRLMGIQKELIILVKFEVVVKVILDVLQCQKCTQLTTLGIKVRVAIVNTNEVAMMSPWVIIIKHFPIQYHFTNVLVQRTLCIGDREEI